MVQAKEKHIEESWELTLGATGLVSTDPNPATGGEPHTFHEYPVPSGEMLVFTRKDTFSLYFYSSSEAAEVNVKGTVEVLIADSAKQNTRPLVQMTRYANLKEFSDADKLAHLDIAPGEEVIAQEGERILIKGESGLGGVLDGSESYFRLTCKRIRPTMFKGM